MTRCSVGMEGKVKNENPIRKFELNTIATKFLSEVSHEFKTPLSSILSSISLIEKYVETRQYGKLDRHIVNIKNEVNSMDLTINEFIVLEKVFQDEVHYNPTHFNLGLVITHVLERLNVLLKPYQKMNYHEFFETVYMFQDVKLIEYILSTVLQKTIEYTPDDCDIHLLVTAQDKKVLFYVSNNGQQMDKIHIETTLETMHNESDTVLVANDGGVGLKMVQNHLKRIGGKINYLGTGKDNMSFILEIPYKCEG